MILNHVIPISMTSDHMKSGGDTTESAYSKSESRCLQLGAANNTPLMESKHVHFIVHGKLLNKQGVSV